MGISHFQHRSVLASSPFLASSAGAYHVRWPTAMTDFRWSAKRIDNARNIWVGLVCPLVGNTEPPAMKSPCTP